MSNLTSKISDINKRLGALESKELDENAGIARISKIYCGVKITALITYRLTTFVTPSGTLYPSTQLFDEICLD